MLFEACLTLTIEARLSVDTGCLTAAVGRPIVPGVGWVTFVRLVTGRLCEVSLTVMPSSTVLVIQAANLASSTDSVELITVPK